MLAPNAKKLSTANAMPPKIVVEQIADNMIPTMCFDLTKPWTPNPDKWTPRLYNTHEAQNAPKSSLE